MESFTKLYGGLPGRHHFKNDLTNEEITDEEWDFVLDLWLKFDLQTMRDLQNMYMGTDALLMADIF